MTGLRKGLLRAASALWILAAASASQAQTFHLFPSPPSVETAGSAASDTGDADRPDSVGESPQVPPQRRCVLIQCVTLPVAPAEKIFNRGAGLWTATALGVGVVVAAQGPIDTPGHGFFFVNERFFQYDTYAGGSDKASHFIVSATVADLLSDAYRINGLSDNQAFALSLGTTVVVGLFVELGDGLTPYGGSAQDLTADALGAFVGAFVKRGGFDDVIGYQLGKVPTELPASFDSIPRLGIDYSHEIYNLNFKFAGIGDHLRRDPGLARYLQLSFAYLTKAYGYQPPIETRYQQVGIELGLNIPEILKAVGVSDSTWWGDTLLRAFRFFRVPYTQIGAYYNFKSRKWYGAGAPYRYY